ncbi:MAG: hypothetical protein HOV78_11590 [Hamadaea sp.]|nr:hypothetical protein [Hamadaea sp.]
MRALTVGAHNLHDEHGLPTFFADVVFYSEAVPYLIRQRRRELIREYRRARAVGFRVKGTPLNHSLAIAVNTRVLTPVSKEYHRAHRGIKKVTPSRGTLILKCRTVDTDRKVALVGEHRINAAFPPYVRGEQITRQKFWGEHTEMTLALVDELEAEGHFVIAGGDLNTPHDISGYESHLLEQGHGLDRLGCSEEGHWSEFARLNPVGSDHHRIRATLTLPKEYR